MDDRSVIDLHLVSRRFVFWFVVAIVGVFALSFLWMALQVVEEPDGGGVRLPIRVQEKASLHWTSSRMWRNW